MYKYNVELKEYNSFRTKALAKVFCEPRNADELKTCLQDYPNGAKLVIGGGCNLFFTRDFDGLVIKPSIYGIEQINNNQDSASEYIFIEAKASEDWDSFVAYCVDKGYSGLENLSYIPGTVGASPIQNIGAYGAEVKDCIYEVKALDMDTLQLVSFSNSNCQFAYRDSIFKRTNKYIVVSVVFRLRKNYTYIPKYADLSKELEGNASPSITDVREAIIRIRKRKLPDEKVLPNCGSFFKNPYLKIDLANAIQKDFPDLPLYPVQDDLVKTSAAFLIDRAGFKGKRVGDIGTYPNQALIVVNYGSENGSDIVSFMEEIQKTVFQKFGVALEPEVKIL